MAVNFETLPGELQSSIFRLLDPISLISFSQSCQKYRRLISPKQQHFVERLLAIECLEEFGGPVLQFRARDNAQDPAWYDKKTSEMRWACTRCLRLLPHVKFHTPYLLRLSYRKPPVDSPAALPCTSWEPNGQNAAKTLQTRRRAEYQAELKKLKLQYHTAVTLNLGRRIHTQPTLESFTQLQDAGLEPFLDMSLSEYESLDASKEMELLDSVARSVESKICGYKRRLRKCNECLYQLHCLTMNVVFPQPGNHGAEQPYLVGPNLGTATVPIVKSRQLNFGSFVHRYFPGFLTDLPSYTSNADQAPSFTIHRQDAQGRFFTTYMIRCPGCSSWKEMAHFRCGNHWPKWWLAHQHVWGADIWDNWDGKPINKEFINSLQCNHCYAARNGRDALAKILLEWYIELLVAELQTLHRNITLGWGMAWQSVETENMRFLGPGDWFALKQYSFEIRTEILSGLPWKDPHDKNKGVSYIKVDAEMLRKMNEKHKRLKENWSKWYAQKDFADSPTSEWNDWFLSWLNGYDNLEAQWLWLRNCRQEVLKRPEAVVEWALSDKGGVDVQGKEVWDQVTDKLSKKWSSVPEIRDL